MKPPLCTVRTPVKKRLVESTFGAAGTLGERTTHLLFCREGESGHSKPITGRRKGSSSCFNCWGRRTLETRGRVGPIKVHARRTRTCECTKEKIKRGPTEASKQGLLFFSGEQEERRKHGATCACDFQRGAQREYGCNSMQ